MSTLDQATADRHLAELDGVTLDLRHDHADVTGGVWRWTRARNDHGQPLMQQISPDGTRRQETPRPLDEVYHLLGPLIPLPLRPTAGEMLAALEGGAQ